jgi:AcrR family transcriptional regulator
VDGRRSVTTLARRAPIVAATIEVLAETGYRDASFARIAEHAGLSSTRLISYHFAGKDELIAAVAAHVIGQMAECVGERVQAGALASAAGAAWSLTRTRRITGMTAYVATMMLLSVGVALLTRSPRFLLAREGWLTAVTGLWFLASFAARRPLPYLFSRPLLEGRLRWPANWELLWDRSPRFHRMWKTSALRGGSVPSPTPRPASRWRISCPSTPSRH